MNAGNNRKYPRAYHCQMHFEKQEKVDYSGAYLLFVATIVSSNFKKLI